MSAAVMPLPSETAPEEFLRDGAPLIATDEIPSCPVCGHGSFGTFAVGFDYELRSCRNAWRMVSCDACAHVWLNPRPAIATLPLIYPKTYYAYNYAARVHPIARRGKEALDRGKMRTILRQLPRAPRSFLDVGCGDGRFLRAMEAQGVPQASTHGLELDRGVVDRLVADGFPVECARVEDCTSIGDGAIDLATMFHVIEHVDDPRAVVGRIARWLAPGGVLAIETPNLDSLDARLFRERHWGGYHFPRHWNLFTAQTLSRVLRDAGLEPVSILYQTGHSFWMYSVHHRLRYAARPRRRLSRLFDPIGSLPFLVGFTAFDKLRAALGARTSAVLMLARKPA